MNRKMSESTGCCVQKARNTTTLFWWRLGWLGLAVVAASVAPKAHAGDRLLGTWGVSEVDGAGGGGLTPWATITGTGSSNQNGGSVVATRLRTQDGYDLQISGAAVGIKDSIELSMARWSFKLGDTVQPGQPLYRVHADFPADLEFARQACAHASGYRIGTADEVPHVFVEF